MQGHRKPGLFSRVPAGSGSAACTPQRETASRETGERAAARVSRKEIYSAKESARQRRVSRCKAALVDSAAGISTQSNGRIRMRMRMRCAGGAEPEVGGHTANLVPIVSAIVLGSSRPLPPAPLGRSIESAPIVPRLPRLRISLAAQYPIRSATYLLLFHAKQQEQTRIGAAAGRTDARNIQPPPRK